MAAVAGSKGRLQITAAPCATRPSFQAHIASIVLAGELSPAEAAEMVVARAKLREVGIDTNMLCNLRCQYCYLDDRVPAAGQLTPDKWMAVLTPLVFDGCKLFAFIGKEPLLDDTAVDVLAGLNELRLTGARFRSGMVTNGTRLDRYIDHLGDIGLNYLDVSLDGLPHVNDRWRGDGSAATALRNLQALLRTDPAHDVFVACVLHQGNLSHVSEFVSCVSDLGVSGIFLSPVLKFTANGRIADWAVSTDELDRIIDQLLTICPPSTTNSFQILLDLPYRYAWTALASHRIHARDIVEDIYEVPFYQPDPALSFYIKLNFLSFSYWRAARITHDGTVLSNMDLAAHPDYRMAHPELGIAAEQFWPRSQSLAFHKSFVSTHSAYSRFTNGQFDRDVGLQLRSHVCTGSSLIQDH